MCKCVNVQMLCPPKRSEGWCKSRLPLSAGRTILIKFIFHCVYVQRTANGVQRTALPYNFPAASNTSNSTPAMMR
jgi:hypothetical protein